METPEIQSDQIEKPKDVPAKLRVGRIEVGINIVVQLIVLVAMLFMVNYMSGKYFKRWSWIGKNHGELSEMTRSLLENLPKPMKAIVFFSQAGEAEQDAAAMLREYELHAQKGKNPFTIEEVDPEANFARARELSVKYRFGAIENVIILDYDGRSKFINTAELAEMEKREQMDEIQARMQGRALPPPQMLAFKGEEVITNEILALTEPKQNKLYIINGHGEYDFNSRRIETLKEYALRQNLLLANLTIADIETIPADANMVLVLGPKFDFSDRDLKVLTDYWERKGHIFMTVGKTGGKTPKLFSWIAARGVKPMDDYVLRIMKLGDEGARAQSGGVISAAPSPITAGLENVGMELLGATQSLQIDRAKEITDQLKITPLMVAPKGFWGDTEFTVDDEIVPQFDEKKDNSGQLTLAVQVEKGASADPNVKLETSRMVIVGNSDFVSDDGFRTDSKAIALASNAINWLLNREHLIKVPPKLKQRSTLTLPMEKLNNIRLWVVLYVPLAVGLFGLYHLCWRHGRNLFVVTTWVALAFLGLVGGWYVLLWQLGMEEARSVPRNLIIAIGTATAIAAVSMIINNHENQKRAGTKN
jgi:hypothetical protein